MQTITGIEATPEYVEKMDKAFRAVCNQINWKHPFSVICGKGQIGIITDAIDWYHAAQATVEQDGTRDKFVVSSPGYQAW